jgi:thiol-disulfide isomerase/thioredoxin
VWTAAIFQLCKLSKWNASAQVSSADLTKVDYNLSLTTLDGTPVSFSQFKGRTIFLNFWATWCGPCRVELPSIQRLYDKTKNRKDFAILVVSWEKPENIQWFIEKEKHTFPAYVLTKNSPSCYSSGGGIPFSLIISPDGNILKKHLGAAEWDQEPLFQSFLSQ